jgi:hypothetical protein
VVFFLANQFNDINRLAHIITGISYFVIPVFLIYFYYKKHTVIRKSWMLLLLIVFIMSRGFSQVFEALVPLNHMYIYYTISDTISAIIAVLATLLVPTIVFEFINYKTPDEYQNIINDRNRLLLEEINKLQKIQIINHDLANQVQALEYTLHLRTWVNREQIKVDELKRIITELRKEYAHIR